MQLAAEGEVRERRRRSSSARTLAVRSQARQCPSPPGQGASPARRVSAPPALAAPSTPGPGLWTTGQPPAGSGSEDRGLLVLGGQPPSRRLGPSGAPTLALTDGAKARLDAMIPVGYEAHVHLTLTDDHPWAQAFVIIEALPLTKV